MNTISAPTMDTDRIPAALRFPTDRTLLYLFEVAAKLDCHKQHIINLVEAGKLEAIDAGSGTRRFLRIPVSSYYDFLLNNNTLINPR